MRHVSPGGMVLATFLMSLYHLSWFLVAWKWIPLATRGSFLTRLWIIVGLSSLWVLLEWLRCQFTLGFPWCPLSVTQWERPALLQLVPVLGGWSVSFFLVTFNACLASYLHHLLVRRYKADKGFLKSFCPDFYFCLLLFLIMLSPFWIKLGQSEEKISKVVSVGVCQPYLKNKWQGEMVNFHKDKLSRQTRFAALLEPELIVWPEASTPYALNLDRAWVEKLATEIDTPMLVGAVIKEDEATYNSVCRVTPEGGLSPEWYRKRVLVPFGEYVPFPFSFFSDFRRLVGPVGNFEEGDTVSLHHISSKSSNSTFKIGSLICYEDIFPSLARDTAIAGAELIFVATNDAWFGEEGCAEQHAAHSVFRALETGRPILRCGNAGLSGWIDPMGRLRDILTDQSGSVYFEGVKVVPIKISTSPETYYLKYGDYFVIFCLVALIFTSIYILKRLKKPII